MMVLLGQVCRLVVLALLAQLVAIPAIFQQTEFADFRLMGAQTQ
jgi:hypothetical protein